MLDNIILPIFTGALALVLLFGLLGALCTLFDNLFEFLFFIITLPILWGIGKLVLWLISISLK